MVTKADARVWARRYVGRHPFLFYNFYRLKPTYRDLLVDRKTQIVIEGFPRSGNTFAVVAFQQAQRESVRVAHHLHMPAQVIRAAKWGIPTLLLARKPTDAALSSSTFSTISAWCSSQRHGAGDLNGQKLRIVPGSAPKTAESGRGSSRRHRPTLDVRPLHTTIL